jgi:PD-(D/E)XK nuclease superfamily protein
VIINVSHLRTHLECPTKALFNYHLKRGPKKKPVALELGTIWHKMMQQKIGSSLSIKEIEFQALQEAALLGGEVYKGLTAILPAFREWTSKDDWTIIAEELALRAPIPYHTANLRHELQGRLDALVMWNGSYWHLQHKTVAASKPISSFALEMERDWHECAYQYLAVHHGFVPYAGTILNTVRKLSAGTILEDPKRALALQYIPRSEEQVRKAVDDISTLCDQIEAGHANPTRVVQNRSSCMGRFGNSPCPYIGVCNGQASLYDDALFESVVDRYPTAV